MNTTLHQIQQRALNHARLFRRFAKLALTVHRTFRRTPAVLKEESPLSFSVLLRQDRRQLLLVFAIEGLESEPGISLEVYIRLISGDLRLIDSVTEAGIMPALNNYLNSIKK